MKLTSFMKMLLEYEELGMKITSNTELIIIYGHTGKLVIPVAQIYHWRIGDLRRSLRNLRDKSKDEQQT